MTETRHKPRREEEGHFVIDAAYFREQAQEAVRTFIAPFMGVWDAATGTERQAIRPSRTQGRGKAPRK